METPEAALIQSWERHLRAADRAPRTIGNYLETLLQAEAYLSFGLKIIDEVQPDAAAP